jgi:hypothetical protein
MTSNPESGITEIVLFRTRPGVADDRLTAAAEALQRDLERFPGYRRRRLLKGDDNQWVDEVEWTSLDLALRAAEEIMDRPSVQSFLELVETDSIKMLHLAPVRHFAAAATPA